MIQRAIPATLLALCTALPALGSDLTFSLGGTGEYDSNVFRRDRDTEDDFIFTIRPGVRLHEDRGDDVNYSISYLMPIELSTQFSDELNDIDHIAQGRVEYRINERLTLNLRDHFRYLRSTLRQERTNPEDVAAGEGVPALSEVRDRVTLNDGSVGVSYLFSPRWVGRANFSSTFFDTTRDDRSKNYSLGGVFDTLYRMSRQHQVGGGARYGFQQFDDREGFAGSETHTVGIFGSWRWIVDETTTLSVSAGPTLLITEQDDSDQTFTSAPVPFEFVPAGTYSGFFDRDNVQQQNRTVGNRSLLVPSFEVVDGGIVSNCTPGRTALEFIAPCQGNVLFDSADPTGIDQATIAAILDPANAVTLTNTDTRGSDSDRITFFAEVVLSKRWSPTLASAFRYSREQGNASGLGGAVVGDSVSLSTTWDFLERWQLAVRGDWLQRESVFRLAQTRVVVVGVTDPRVRTLSPAFGASNILPTFIAPALPSPPAANDLATPLVSAILAGDGFLPVNPMGLRPLVPAR